MTLIALPQNALFLKPGFGLALTQRKAIETMCERIATVGLLNPLVVTKKQSRYFVVDGKKRFQAIKTLARRNKLPRTLNKVPCILKDDETLASQMHRKPVLMSEQDLAHHIMSADASGATYEEISALFDCSEEVITQARSISRLHPKLKLAFINNTINLAQAAALSSIPNPQAQWDLLTKLGPFATEPEIIAAIADGETVLELPNGDMMILPTRTPYSPIQMPALSFIQSDYQIAA